MTLEERARLIADRRGLTPGSFHHRAVEALALQMLREAVREAGMDRDPAVIEKFDTLRSWVNDLQSGMFINCVYCGHRYGPSDQVPASMADVLKAHVEQCPAHPMSKLKAALRAAYEVYAGSDGFTWQSAAEGYQQKIIKQMVAEIQKGLEQ
jgi:hypothetical protein